MGRRREKTGTQSTGTEIRRLSLGHTKFWLWMGFIRQSRCGLRSKAQCILDTSYEKRSPDNLSDPKELEF